MIGGGLTAIDTATESLAYYPLQVEKFLSRYETLAAERGEEAVRPTWTPAERETAVEFIAHARAIRAEREAARREGHPPRLANLIDGWGGVTIAYRRRLTDSPSYTLNHEEVAKAMEEGIRFAELLTPAEVDVDVFGHAAALRLTRHSPAEVGGHRPEPNQGPGEEVVLPARTILVAAGTQPNTVLGREDPDNITLDGRYFRALDEDGNPATPERVAQAGGGAGPDASAPGRARRQLFRRPPPELFRQCRQGDGRRRRRATRWSAAPSPGAAVGTPRRCS